MFKKDYTVYCIYRDKNYNLQVVYMDFPKTTKKKAIYDMTGEVCWNIRGPLISNKDIMEMFVTKK